MKPELMMIEVGSATVSQTSRSHPAPAAADAAHTAALQPTNLEVVSGGEEWNDLDAMLADGLFLDRVAARRLKKKLEKFGEPARMCVAQIQGALDRKGWKKISLSAKSLEALRRTGLTIGIVQ